MAKTIIRAHMKQRRDTAVNWQAQNPILLDGEIGIVTDQPDRYKVGDGVTEWNALPLRGFDGNIVQMTGGSRTAVMSQWAVTHALEEVENNMLKPEDLTAATKVLASKAELSVAVEGLENKMLKPEDLTAATKDLASKTEVSEVAEAVGALTAEVLTDEEVTAAALNDLNTRVNALPSSVDSELSDTSENPVQNKTITAKLSEKQDALVSGTSIKTINGQSLLGEGDLEVITDLSATASKAELQDLANVVTEVKTELQESLEALTAEVLTDEEVTAAALNDLNGKITEISAIITEIIARLDALSA